MNPNLLGIHIMQGANCLWSSRGCLQTLKNRGVDAVKVAGTFDYDFGKIHSGHPPQLGQATSFLPAAGVVWHPLSPGVHPALRKPLPLQARQEACGGSSPLNAEEANVGRLRIGSQRSGNSIPKTTGTWASLRPALMSLSTRRRGKEVLSEV
jgi:hypothetical protein